MSLPQHRQAESIRLQGAVQGMGLRPTIYRLANQLCLDGDVQNDCRGVRVRVSGDTAKLDEFVECLENAIGNFAAESTIERAVTSRDWSDGFSILESSDKHSGATEVLPDQAICSECVAEIFDPLSRYFRYPLLSCTQCGPRYSIQAALPWDRFHTSMKAFELCDACRAAYGDPNNRRFHAQTQACHVCGPQVHLERIDGAAFSVEQFTHLDEIDAATTLIQRGAIIAVQGIGGFHLVCDSTNEEAVAELRKRKQRPHKPLALMARDLDLIEQHCVVSDLSGEALKSAAAPIVLLEKRPDDRLTAEKAMADSIASGMSHLGWMLPSSGVHHLLLRRMHRPVVMTSANISGQPQCVDVQQVREQLADIADWILWNDRRILQRLDDSVVVEAAGRMRVLRHGRGLAPASVSLPDDFDNVPSVLSFGAHQKSGFSLLRDRRLLASPHLGAADSQSMREDFERCLQHSESLFRFSADQLSCDQHPEYFSQALAQQRSEKSAAPLMPVQHHHAHAASCLLENGRFLDAAPVLAIVFDGVGLGGDGSLWGGEFLKCDYRDYKRLAALKPVVLPGGDAAAKEPWRNTWAHLQASMGWSLFQEKYADLPLCIDLGSRPIQSLESMRQANINAPLSSSAGRLFDAVSYACGLAPSKQSFEGQAGMLLEAAARSFLLSGRHAEQSIYSFSIGEFDELLCLDPSNMWHALIADLQAGRSVEEIAWKFHQGLAAGMTQMVQRLFEEQSMCSSNVVAMEKTVALSGGVFQNRVLLEASIKQLSTAGFTVLSHERIPPNDQGISAGQAVIAAARKQKVQSNQPGVLQACA